MRDAPQHRTALGTRGSAVARVTR